MRDFFIEVRDFFVANPDKWGQGNGIYAPKREKICLGMKMVEIIHEKYFNVFNYDKARDVFLIANGIPVPVRFGQGLISFNDTHTYEEVISALNNTIAALKE